MTDRIPPDPEKLRALQNALDAYAAGEGTPLIDVTHERATARIRDRALRLLDQRSRSRHELREKLLSPSWSASRRPDPDPVVAEPELVDEVLDSLERAGLINDEVFAREWVRQRFEHRGKSAKALDLELKQKGVSESIRADALSQIDAHDERELARALADKKARAVKVPPADRAARDKELRRIVGVLARRGFPPGLALEIARDALDDRVAEIESAESN